MKPFRSNLTISTCCLIFALLAACGGYVTTPSPSEVETVVALTFAVMTGAEPGSTPKTDATSTPISFTAIPSPTIGIIPTEISRTYRVQTAVQNVNLRVGPGTLFQVSRVLAQGTPLEVNGLSRGGEWLYVINEEGIFGWVLTPLVQGVSYDGPPPPVVEPQNVYLVTGIVKTEAGTPVSGIGFAITKGFAVDAPRSDATTDVEGRFYAYLPATLTGTWNVGYVSVACTSNTMDANCNCKGGVCGRAFPETVEITMPPPGGLVFTWK